MLWRECPGSPNKAQNISGRQSGLSTSYPPPTRCLTIPPITRLGLPKGAKQSTQVLTHLASHLAPLARLCIQDRPTHARVVESRATPHGLNTSALVYAAAASHPSYKRLNDRKVCCTIASSSCNNPAKRKGQATANRTMWLACDRRTDNDNFQNPWKDWFSKATSGLFARLPLLTPGGAVVRKPHASIAFRSLGTRTTSRKTPMKPHTAQSEYWRIFTSADLRPCASELWSWANGMVAYATQSICRVKSGSDINLPTACKVFSLLARAESRSARPSAMAVALVAPADGAGADDDDDELAPTPEPIPTPDPLDEAAPATDAGRLDAAFGGSGASPPLASARWPACCALAEGRKMSSKLRAHPSLTQMNKIIKSFVCQLSRQKRHARITEYHLNGNTPKRGTNGDPLFSNR